MEEKKKQNQSQQKKQNNYDRLDLQIIYNAKQAGYSFKEMSQLRVRDLFILIDMEIDSFGNKSATGVRKATQKDINRLFA